MNKVQFAVNEPETVTIGTPGRIVEGRYGKQVSYYLQDGRWMYLDLGPAQKLNALELRTGESVAICKRGKGRWDVWLTPETEKRRATEESPGLHLQSRKEAVLRVPVLGSQAGANVTAPAPAAETAATAFSNGPRSNGNGSTLAGEIRRLIDEYAAALEYARRHGELVRPEDVRELLAAAYREQRKAVTRAAA